jgi:hypothetical protein
VADQPVTSGAADLGRRDVPHQQPKATLGREVEYALEAWVDAHEQAVQTAKATGLFVNQVAAASHQETQLEVDLGAGLDRPQVVSGAHLIGDDAGIPGIALGLAAGRPLACPVYCQARHVDQPEAGRREHRFGKAGDAADHIEADCDLALQ